MEYALMILVPKKALSSAHSRCFSKSSSSKFFLLFRLLTVFRRKTEFVASPTMAFTVALWMDSFDFGVMLFTGYGKTLTIVICAQDCITLGTFDEVKSRGMSARIKGPFDFFKT